MGKKPSPPLPKNASLDPVWNVTEWFGKAVDTEGGRKEQGRFLWGKEGRAGKKMAFVARPSGMKWEREERGAVERTRHFKNVS